jgi:hypothetical protein
MKNSIKSLVVLLVVMGAVSVASAQLPDPGNTIDPANTALVVTDPQNDFVSDGTAAAVVPDGDGYAAALTNFRFIANAVRTTEQVATELVGTDNAQRFIRESRGESKD